MKNINKTTIDTTRITLEEAQQLELQKVIKDMIHSAEFLYLQINDNNVSVSSRDTMCSLFESYFSEISNKLGYTSKFLEERNSILEEIRQENKKHYTNILQVGADTILSPEQVSASLNYYEKALRAWYEACGFHYASITNTSYGFLLEFSAEIDYCDEDDNVKHRLCKDESIQSLISQEYLFNDEKYDIVRDTYHGELLATENNRERLVQLYQETFPNAHLYELYERRNDYGSFSLKHSVRIPFEDITCLLKK